MSLKDVRVALLGHVMALPGIKAAPENPPESVGLYPFAVAYPQSGSGAGGATGELKGLHSMVVEIHCNRVMLPQAVEQAEAYIEPFLLRMVGDPTLGGTVDTVRMDEAVPILYQFGRLSWNGVDTIGVRFQVTVKKKLPV